MHRNCKMLIERAYIVQQNRNKTYGRLQKPQSRNTPLGLNRRNLLSKTYGKMALFT